MDVDTSWLILYTLYGEPGGPYGPEDEWEELSWAGVGR